MAGIPCLFVPGNTIWRTEPDPMPGTGLDPAVPPVDITVAPLWPENPEPHRTLPE
jgi:hypothetical protein